MTLRHGILLVDKSAGPTSHDVVETVRRTLSPGRARRGAPRYRCGHAGTLDPLATGLLVVLCGAASRLSNFLLGHDKTYRATVRFGTATDSLDADGVVVEERAVTAGTAAIEPALAGLRGPLLQRPPLISALKRDGRTLHSRVRAGEIVAEPEPRPVTVHDLVLEGVRWEASGPDGAPVWEVDLFVRCSAGTYVRSLARDLAAALGTVGHLTALRRESIGDFLVADALPDARLREAGTIAAALRPLSAALPEAPGAALTTDEAAAVRAGRQPEPAILQRLDAPPAPVSPGGEPLLTLLDEAGGLVAVCRLDATGAPVLAAVFPPVGAPGAEGLEEPCD